MVSDARPDPESGARPISLTAGEPPVGGTAEVLATAMSVPGLGSDVAATLAWCVEVGRSAPHVGRGRTRELWELLASTAALSVSAARMLEPHLDALSILAQATRASDPADARIEDRVDAAEDSSWGVFAAEGPGMRLEAKPRGEDWLLDGTKPWCSLAASLSHALVTAFVEGGRRRLFAVDLRHAGVEPHEGEWVARGMPDVVSSPVEFTRVPAVAVGEAGWYLERPGFAWGGMSVAACWFGGAAALADALARPARSERADQLALVHLGRVDAALWAARATLAEAAALVDGSGSAAVGEKILAERVRAVVADAATLALAEADSALGPAPLVSDQRHAANVADLHLYLRQHHGLRDTARIGRLLVDSP